MEGIGSAVSTVLPCEAVRELVLEQPHPAQPCAARTLFDRPCPRALISCCSRVWRPSLLPGQFPAPPAFGPGSGAAPRALLLGRCSSGTAAWALLGRQSLGAAQAPLLMWPLAPLLRRSWTPLPGRSSGAAHQRSSRVAPRRPRALLARRYADAPLLGCPRALLGRRPSGAARAPLSRALQARGHCVCKDRSRPSSTTRPSSQCHFNPTAHKAIISARATGPAPRARNEAAQMRPSRCVPRRICLSHRFWWFVGPCCVRAGAWGELPG